MFWTFHSYTDRGAHTVRPPLDGEASEHCARGVFTMIKLRALKLNNVTSLDDGFFSVMSESASQSQVDLTLLSPPPPPPSLPLSLSFIQCVSNSCIRLPMWEIFSGHMTGIENHWHETNLWWVSKSAKTLWVFYIEVDANHLHEFVCLLVYLFFVKIVDERLM